MVRGGQWDTGHGQRPQGRWKPAQGLRDRTQCGAVLGRMAVLLSFSEGQWV